MTPFPMRLNRADFRAIAAKAKARKERRLEKQDQNAALKGCAASPDRAGDAFTHETMPGHTPPSMKPEGVDIYKSEKNASKSLKDAQGRVIHRVIHKIKTTPKIRRVSGRRRAFNRLKELCKTFVLMRNAKTRNGMCEIAMACGGENVANTWYHGWPQSGGNGLKYDARSHFASCGPCNMGEYGGRMYGSPLYVNRHKELLGDPLWQELDALHGRRPISTKEAMEMAQEYERKISAGEWI